MINFDCDKVIILHYEMGAGGRFLGNTLSLSPDCVMMNAKLAMMQLDGKLTLKQKLSILLKGIDNTGHVWTDALFRDENWFGLDYDTTVKKLGVVEYWHLDDIEFHNVYTHKDFRYLTINNTKYLFLTTHCKKELNKLKSIWKNSKTISFKNERLFCHIRDHRKQEQRRYKTIWSLIPKQEMDGWVDFALEPPISHAVFRDYPPYVHTLVAKYLNDSDFFEKVKEILDYKYSIPVPKYFTDYKNLLQEEKEILESENTSEEYVDPDSIFVWDCNWYLSEQNTIHNIKYLYDVLELEGYDEQSARSYYRSWIKKLEELI